MRLIKKKKTKFNNFESMNIFDKELINFKKKTKY